MRQPFQDYLDKIQACVKEHNETKLSDLCRQAYADYCNGLLSEEEYTKIYIQCMDYAYPR